MGSYGKKSVSFEGVIDLQQAVSYLEGLVAAIRSGTITLEMDGDAVSLRPARNVSLSIEAKRKEERERLTLEMSWSREREAIEPGLKIHDREMASADYYEDEDFSDEEAEVPAATELPTESILIGTADSEVVSRNTDEDDEDDDRHERKKKKKKK